ncbi:MULTISPECIES: hypothetical protein [Allobaculum]|uniref:hypothetical protein n=1 Tax=Allobaculum TaxID=174708 RepID=UPI001E317296|nr:MULTISPECIES: hypothetical protein [Allobaculum]UNT92609.1 hypothetical protein KWG61_10795 [Allobaculum sp. Allo2]
MRYDTKIELVRSDPGHFNPDTCNYEDRAETKTALYASVMDTRAEMLKLVYGSLKQGSLTIHIQNHTDIVFDQIEVRGRRYKVDFRRRLRTKESFIVSEVQT